MGIPTYFRYIIEKFSDKIVTYNQPIDYFYIDFNSLIYNTYFENRNRYREEQDLSLLLENILKNTKQLIQLVNPKKEVFIAVDGSIPMAKIHQQRSRRYKAYYQSYLLNNTKMNTVDISHLACPGTNFMAKLGSLFEKKKEWLKNSVPNKPNIIISSADEYGEGEQKIMIRMKKMFTKAEGNNRSIAVFSPDNDLLSLLVLLHLPNSAIHLLRFLDPMMASLLNVEFIKDKLIYISIDMLATNFVKKEMIIEKPCIMKDWTVEDKKNLILDYNFLLSITGNDWVISHPYLKIKNQGLDKIMSIYQMIASEKEFMINRETLDINTPMLIKLIRDLSKREISEFQAFHNFLNYQRTHPDKRIEYQEGVSLKEKEELKLSHVYICNPSHPLFKVYEKDFFDSIDFRLAKLDMHTFKKQFYSYFITRQDYQNHKKQDIVKEMVEDYLLSLKFTLLYYNQGCPCFRWYYKFRTAPLFSDVLYYLEKGLVDINKLSFPESNRQRLSPIEQLFLILPKSSLKQTVEKDFENLILKYKKEDNPSNIKVDALVGVKFIYSECILPNFKNLSSLSFDLKRVLRNLPLEQQKKYTSC